MSIVASGNFQFDLDVLTAEMILQGTISQLAPDDQLGMDNAHIVYYQTVMASAAANDCSDSQAITALTELGYMTTAT